MKRVLVFVSALSLLAPVAAPVFAQPSATTRPAKPKPPPHKPRPPKPRPPAHKPKPPAHRPPANGHKPKPPPHHPRPPAHRPPAHHPKPPVWHKPRPNQWYWRGRWVNRIRGPVFHYPRGYGYRHWSVGGILPALFLVSTYFYDDIGPLGLEAPPPGYRWVRYGPDLLLVNLSTGQVEQVAYGVFY
jgi:Ni/Co efflux regulator RcnB